MKKVLAVCLAVVLVVSAGVLAFAQGGFVSSPSGNKGPEISDVILGDLTCNPRVVITPYAEREKLDDQKEAELNKAYDEISANSDLSNLTPDLKAIAAALGVSHLRFAVSELFDISVYHTLPHDYCGEITVKLTIEAPENYSALIHRDSENGWEIVPDVVVDKANKTLTFTGTEFSPFAIVVDKEADALPNTGSMLYIPAIAMVVSAISLVVVLVSIKKKKEA